MSAETEAQPPAQDAAVPPASAPMNQEQAEAMAEVAAMERNHHRNANPQAEVAMMGGEGAPEVTDESGELLQQRFLQFLGSL